MIVPNKVITLDESIIGKMVILLEKLKGENFSINELFFETQEHFEEIDEFIYSLDVLFLLDKIQVDFSRGAVIYVS